MSKYYFVYVYAMWDFEGKMLGNKEIKGPK
jgi:hypothetical protein